MKIQFEVVKPPPNCGDTHTATGSKGIQFTIPSQFIVSSASADDGENAIEIQWRKGIQADAPCPYEIFPGNVMLQN